jgi:hypothetical protein
MPSKTIVAEAMMPIPELLFLLRRTSVTRKLEGKGSGDFAISPSASAGIFT